MVDPEFAAQVEQRMREWQYDQQVAVASVHGMTNRQLVAQTLRYARRHGMTITKTDTGYRIGDSLLEKLGQ